MTTLECVQRAVAEAISVPAETVKPEASLIDLGADSLEVVEIAMSIETDCGVEIPDEDFERLRTVQQLVDYVETARAVKA